MTEQNGTALVRVQSNAGLAVAQDPVSLGRVLAASGYFTDARDAAQAAVKVMAGAELGFPPIASMTGVYIVKGKVTLSANLIAAAIKRSGRYTYKIGRLDDAACEITFYEQGEALSPASSFTIEDAKKAGLASGDNWRKYPRNMLFARALSNGAKFHCPDVFGGPIYTPDELGEEVDPETGEIKGYAPPPTAEVVEPADDPDLHGEIPHYLPEERVEHLYGLFKQSGAKADELKLALIPYGIEGVRSAKAGLSLLADDQADQLEAALEKRIAKASA